MFNSCIEEVNVFTAAVFQRIAKQEDSIFVDTFLSYGMLMIIILRCCYTLTAAEVLNDGCFAYLIRKCHRTVTNVNLTKVVV